LITADFEVLQIVSIRRPTACFYSLPDGMVKSEESFPTEGLESVIKC
jgi:hypothetical protein